MHLDLDKKRGIKCRWERKFVVGKSQIRLRDGDY